MYVAIKEAKDETGIKNEPTVSDDILSLGILPVLGHMRKGKYVPPHLHLSLSYLLEADENEQLILEHYIISVLKTAPNYCFEMKRMG